MKISAKICRINTCFRDFVRLRKMVINNETIIHNAISQNE